MIAIVGADLLRAIGMQEPALSDHTLTGQIVKP